MDVPAAEHHRVVVDEPDVLVHNVMEVTQAPASLVDEEAGGLPGDGRKTAAQTYSLAHTRVHQRLVLTSFAASACR
jgi:hypothetical protein